MEDVRVMSSVGNISTGFSRTTLKVNVLFQAALLALIAFCAKRTVQNGDPIIYMIPNFLLFTPFRELTKYMWSVLDPLSRLTDVKEPVPIGEIPREGFSMEVMKECTEGWFEPCVARGVFAGTQALKNWGKKDYLSQSALRDFNVIYAGDAAVEFSIFGENTSTFSELSSGIINGNSSISFLIPPGNETEFKLAVNKLVHDDLELSYRIKDGFGLSPEVHKNFIRSQVVMGRGKSDTSSTSGTDWHCEATSNWFIQVIGTKRWYFLNPRYSSLMSPLRSTHVIGVLISESRKKILNRFKYLPLSYVDVNEGDMLYVPSWYWHTVLNGEGLTIGCPIRVLNLPAIFRNQAQYSTIVSLDLILSKLGF